MNIRLMAKQDWHSVVSIYTEGLQTGQATFETQPPTQESWWATHIAECSFVAEDSVDLNNHMVVLGWAALSRVSQRQVYAGVAEVSIYIATAARGKQVGLQLMERLIDASENQGFWTLQSSIFPENIASIRLHERCGFRVVGYREKIAQHYGVWRDTVLMERRSEKIGRSVVGGEATSVL